MTIPAVRTVEVDAFCSWSICTIRMTSSALASRGSTSYRSEGTYISVSAHIVDKKPGFHR